MKLFDLLFIVVFLTCVVMLVFARVQFLRGRRAQAVIILRRLGIAAGVYLGIVILVSLVSPGGVLHVGDDRCWDDWCLTVTDVQRTSAENGTRYVVSIRISSRARRVAQRGRGTHVYLMDDRGRRYDPLPDPDEVPFDTLLRPMEAISMTRVFDLPSDAPDPVLVASHGGGFPGLFIIGDSGSLFHKPTVVRLE